MALSFRLRWLKPLMAVCLMVLLTACSRIYFLPLTPWVQNPERQELAYEDVILIHPDGMRIHGWWIPALLESGETAKGTIYFLHGNAENISTHLMAVRWLPPKGYHLFMLDYRGFGLSEGTAKLPGVFADIQLGLDWLSQAERTQAPLIVYGQSIGAATTSYVLAQEQNQTKYQCAVLEAGFTSYREAAAHIMGQSWIKIFKPLVLPMLANDWAPSEQVAKIQPPLLIVHSTKDEIIPYRHGEQLFANATEPKAMLTLDSPHIGGNFSEKKQQNLLQFFNQQCRL